MLKQYKIVQDKITETAEPGASILVFIAPDDAEKKALVEKYAIDDHTLNSSLDPDELSRIEFEPGHIAMIAKFPKNYSGKRQFLFRVGTMGVFIFKETLIIVLVEDVGLFDGKLFTKITSVNEVLLKIMYSSIHHFNGHLKVFNMIADDLERKISRAMENKALLNLFTLEKSVVYYLNAINSNGIVMEKMKTNALKFGLDQEQAELLDDIIVENKQCYQQAEIYSNIFASLMDARVSIVSNNLNTLMKTLNIMTIAIMVPTLVVSAFSMNVRIPLSELYYAFWIILILAALSVVVFLLIMRRLGW